MAQCFVLLAYNWLHLIIICKSHELHTLEKLTNYICSVSCKLALSDDEDPIHFDSGFIAGISFSALFDTLVFFLTLNKTLSTVREGRRLRMTNGITFLLLRDGE